MRVFIVLIALCVAAQGQVPTVAPKSNDESATGSITGRVVNESGQPVAGASATVRRTNSSTGRTTTTDAEGNFRVNNLDRGLYIITASAAAHITLPSNSGGPPTYYRLGDTANVRLVRGGIVTGTVTNSFGEPVVAVRVRAMMIRDVNGRTPTALFDGLRQNQTDDRGVYRLWGLLPGTYIVSAGGAGMQQFNFNPYDFDTPTYAPSSTRDDAAEVTVTNGEETNVDIRYRGEAGYTISGTVKVAAPTNTASISITPAKGTLTFSGNIFQPPNSRGFALNGISDGEYDLVAQEFPAAQGATMPVIQLSEPRRVIVKGASVSGVELTTKPLGVVTGKIVLESSKVPACQGKRPPLLTESLVQLRRPERDPEKDTAASARVFGMAGSPDPNGAFVLRNLSPGNYQFEPIFYARYWYLRSIAIGKTDAAANWTTVKFSDQLTNLTITLAEGAASVRGKLASGEPTPGMVLYLVPSEPDKAADVLRFFVSEIAADGTFALNNLPPGRYWVLTQPTADAQTATMTRLREPEASTVRTKLRKTAETKKAEIQLKPCQNLANYELKP